jgi:hypothetical protein
VVVVDLEYEGQERQADQTQVQQSAFRLVVRTSAQRVLCSSVHPLGGTLCVVSGMSRNPAQNEERILVVMLPYTNVGKTVWPVESKENMKDKHFKKVSLHNFLT